MRFSVLVVLALLLGCSDAPADLEVEFLKAARRTTIIPVFPPKEDIQVGDFIAQSIGGPNDILREYLATDPNVVKLASNYMAGRIVFRETTTVSTALVANAPSQADTYGKTFATRSDLPIESLPIEALPTVTVDAGTAFGFGRTGIFSALGLAGGRRTKVTLDFGDVRTYGIPRSELSRFGYDPNKTFSKISEAQIDAIDSALNERYRTALIAGRNILPWEERCRATVVITRVFLTRQIKYTFFDGRISAIAAAAAREGNRPSAPDVPPINVTISNNEINTAEVEKATDALSAEVLSSTQQAGVSGSLTFEGFSVLGATYTQVFQRPVVVGYEVYRFPEFDLPLSPEELGTGRPSPETLSKLEAERKKCEKLELSLP